MAKFKKLALLCSAILMTTSLAVGIAACEEEHVHTYGTAWEKDATNHWYGCTDETCTLEIGKEAHKWNDGEITTNPTETEAGVKTFTCVVCAQTKTEAVAALGHVHTAATEWSKDATNHWHACTNGTECTEKLDVAAHAWNDGVVTTAATEDVEGVMTYTCTVEGCGATKTEAIAKLNHVHVYDDTWETNAEKHWFGCTKGGCTTGKIHEKNHEWDDGEETLSPTEETFGEMVYTCKVCGYEKEVEIPKLTPDPLRVAKGTAEITATSGYGGNTDVVINFAKAGVYVVKTDNASIENQTLDLTEAGEQTINFEVYDINASYTTGDIIKVNYTVTEVPVVTPTEMEGEVEMTANTNVKVSFTVPTAGRYMLTVDDSVTLESYINEGGQLGFYYFETMEDGETVTLWAKVESNDEKVTVAYALTQLTATEVYEGNNKISLISEAFTEVAFTAPAAGAYKISTYDDDVTFWKDTAYTSMDKANGYYYVEATEADEVISFFVKSWNGDVTSFNISEFTDEERYSSEVSFTFEEEATTATTTVNLKAGASIPVNVIGAFIISYEAENVALSFYDVAFTTQKVVLSVSMMDVMMNMTTPMLTNNGEEDVEVTITAEVIDELNPLTTMDEIEIYVGTESFTLPYAVDGKYDLTITNSDKIIVFYNFDPASGDVPTTDPLSATAQTVESDGTAVPLYFENHSGTSLADPAKPMAIVLKAEKYLPALAAGTYTTNVNVIQMMPQFSQPDAYEFKATADGVWYIENAYYINTTSEDQDAVAFDEDTWIYTVTVKAGDVITVTPNWNFMAWDGVSATSTAQFIVHATNPAEAV